MQIKGFLLFLNMLMFGGLYIMFTGGTVGSTCRDLGIGIRHASIDTDGTGGFDGARATLSDLGQSIEDTCTRR